MSKVYSPVCKECVINKSNRDGPYRTDYWKYGDKGRYQLIFEFRSENCHFCGRRIYLDDAFSLKFTLI